MLTILVKKRFLEEIARGEKTREYRLAAGRYREEVFHVGRHVRFICEHRRICGWVDVRVSNFTMAEAGKADADFATLQSVYPGIKSSDRLALIDFEVLAVARALRGAVADSLSAQAA